MDIDTGENIDSVDTVVDPDHDECIIITKQLTVRRNYNITVHASNNAGSATSYKSISKHKIT